MPVVIDDSAATWDTVQAPTDGDPGNGATFQLAPTAVARRTKYLKNIADNLGFFSSVQSISEQVPATIWSATGIGDGSAGKRFWYRDSGIYGNWMCQIDGTSAPSWLFVPVTGFVPMGCTVTGYSVRWRTENDISWVSGDVTVGMYQEGSGDALPLISGESVHSLGVQSVYATTTFALVTPVTIARGTDPYVITLKAGNNASAPRMMIDYVKVSYTFQKWQG